MSHGAFSLMQLPELEGSRMPGNTFGRLVGEYLLHTRVPMGGTRPDDNHIYLRLRAAGAVYECAVNIRSSVNSGDPRVEYTEREEGVATAPDDGFSVQSLSFKEMGLKQADFAPVQDGDLYTLVANLVMSSERVAVYGRTYSSGNGIHDVHMNSGEPAGSSHPSVEGEDGALVCYVRTDPKSLEAHWIFLKFSTQMLG